MAIKRLLIMVLIATGIASCSNSSLRNHFSVTGTIKNNTAKTVYLEELPPSSQPVVVDSGLIDKEGRFTLGTSQKESMLYSLRLDQDAYPLVYIINDAEKIDLNIQLTSMENRYAENYEIHGSPASQEMKDFVAYVNKGMQKIYYNSFYIDSLERAGAADEVLFSLASDQQKLADEIKTYSEKGIDKADNPALFIFELGFYQAAAGSSGLGLEPLDDEKIREVVDKKNRQFSTHRALAAIKKTFDEQSLLGKQAPDFSLPDANGNEVSLNSFRGKYVLVDFWASWCVPCRLENPNIVHAYNQYKDKNFTVLGVSLDRPGQKEEWLQAIKEDNLSWTHVSDLKFWESSVVPLYRIGEIPYNVLIDPDGKIIAEKLKGQKLDEKLEQVLK